MIIRLCFLAFLLTSFRTDEYSIEWHYITTHQDLAIAEMHRHGVPASIILAQALVESDAGRSILAMRANNHFGIKCKSWWTGGRYYYADDDKAPNGQLVPSCFRFYASAEESFADHSTFLRESERYQELFSYGNDYLAWAQGLQRCGYATDARYGQRLIQTIERFGLSAFDQR